MDWTADDEGDGDDKGIKYRQGEVCITLTSESNLTNVDVPDINHGH